MFKKSPHLTMVKTDLGRVAFTFFLYSVGFGSWLDPLLCNAINFVCSRVDRIMSFAIGDQCMLVIMDMWMSFLRILKLF